MKQIHPVLRTVFITGCALSLMAGIQLFVLAEQTDMYFAWTIQSHLTAALIGGFFFGTMTFGYLAFREPVWENVRGAVMGLFVILILKLAATLLHLDKFHFSGQTFTIFVTWVWVATYFVLPFVVLIGLILQNRIPASARDTTSSLPAWLQVSILLHGLSGLAAGLILFLSPQTIIPLWGWSLTPLTSRALSAWLLSFAVVDWFMFRDNDWARMKIMSVEYGVSVFFSVIAFIRYSGEVNWSSLGAAGFLAYLALMIAIGAAGILRNR